MTAMCRTTAYRSTTCNHRWLTITARCGPNVGFTTTPIHEFRCDSMFFGKLKFMKAPAGSCPNCNLKGQYDGNTTRMVLGNGQREIKRNMVRGIGIGGGGLVTNRGVYRNDFGYQYPVQAAMPLQARTQEYKMTHRSAYATYQPGLGHAGEGYPIAQKYTYGFTRRPSDSSCIAM